MSDYNVLGTIYLLHFDRPYHHARHYIGWTAGLDARLEAHSCGRGARLITVITAAGIGYQVARTWSGTRKLERRIKNLGGAAAVCPVCSPGNKNGRFESRKKAKAVVS